MRAVIDRQAQSVLGFHRSERFAGFDTIEAYQEWADFFVVSGRPSENGCSPGSLASEIVKTDLDVRDDVTRVFAEWRDIFRAELERMQYDGRLDASADPARLAHMLIAAYQGGSLLAQIARDVVPYPRPRREVHAGLRHPADRRRTDSRHHRHPDTPE